MMTLLHSVILQETRHLVVSSPKVYGITNSGKFKGDFRIATPRPYMNNLPITVCWRCAYSMQITTNSANHGNPINLSSDNVYFTLLKIACFQASGGRCGWKPHLRGTHVAIKSRSYRATKRRSRPGDRSYKRRNF